MDPTSVKQHQTFF